jgi:hypothetical protein
MGPFVMTAMLHPTTFLALDPETGQRSLLAEVHPEVAAGAEEAPMPAFQRRMFDRNIRVGLLVTPTWTYVVRDLLRSMDLTTNEFAVDRLATAPLLAAAGLKPGIGPDYSRQVLTWLEAVAGSWHSFVPHDAVSIMVPEVVGNLAQAHFEVWDDVLGEEDARG